MKKLYAAIFFLVCICFTNAQSQNWLWAKSASGSSSDAGYSISADADGNVFTTGEFTSPTITFGSTTLTNNGTYNVFIAKYDASGNVLWAKSAGGSGADVGYSVSADAKGNVFITGYFHSPAITFGTEKLSNAGVQNIFIAKYDANGNVLWAKSAGGISSDAGYSVSADADGNVFVTGYFSSPAITFGSTTLINSGGYDLFIAKYDADGNVLWAKSATGTNDDLGFSVSADAGGNVFVTGNFGSSSFAFGSTTLANAGNYDVFIAKYDANGNLIWAKSAGGIGDDGGTSVSADANGNMFVTGYFTGLTVTFGSTTLNNAGTENVFIAKYDANGNLLWAKDGAGASYEWGCSINADTDGNVFVTGGFSGSAITFGSTTLTPPAGSSDPMFVVKYDANGNVLCASALAGGGGNNDVSVDPFGNACIVGDFVANPFVVGSDTLFPGALNADNVFVAKYTCNNTVAVNELSKDESISVYPNPTSGKIQVAGGSGSQYKIEIYNEFGEAIYATTNSGRDIDISNSPKGIYFIRIYDGEIIHNRKIVVQ